MELEVMEETAAPAAQVVMEGRVVMVEMAEMAVTAGQGKRAEMVARAVLAAPAA